MASAMLRGNTWLMNVLRLKSPALTVTALAACAWGRLRLRSAPGWNRLTSSIPRARENTEALTNHSIERRPMRPTEAELPRLLMPATSVANTSGAMIILIMRRKMSVTRLK
ncbi:hypothetical protein D9M71_735950 [compost metagenome]